MTKERPLINISYKYNTHGVLSFITTEDVGIKNNSGIKYLSKYPGKFANVDIWPVAHTITIYKLFGYFNKMDSHKKSRKFDLAL